MTTLAPHRDVRAHATAQALAALDTTRPTNPAHHRLRSYYDSTGEYAGSTFAMLEPSDPKDITAADVLSLNALSIRVGPGSIRRLLDPSSTYRASLLQALAAVPTDVPLSAASPQMLECMAALHAAAKAALSAPSSKEPNAWVSAAKLCARKRPHLMPVRDSEVCALLGLIPRTGRARALDDYLTFQHLARHPEVQKALDDATAKVREIGDPNVTMDTARLRLLDAALWTYKMWVSG